MTSINNCLDLKKYLCDEDSCDIVASKLYEELIVFWNSTDKNMNGIKVLYSFKKNSGAFFNTEIFLRILLTIPVTWASIERSFSKFKIVRNYSRNTISEKNSRNG